MERRWCVGIVDVGGICGIVGVDSLKIGDGGSDSRSSTGGLELTCDDARAAAVLWEGAAVERVMRELAEVGGVPEPSYSYGYMVVVLGC